ncbi:hypothetical protein [Phyllobacterium sp. P30BS-XVII]|uniref:hypothetical protein n=1 Tax=Phyllobacterium sp. P30BS-XVII TaxID=2587046 RepID=UPI0015FD2473|nr:hypothetical protein [Phyllobacterium sp. P30BS-XVII]MBA8904175.1 hypothetical protein [Phyllobacterium sp. P30BS-XVII]
MNDIEREAIILEAAWAMIDDMVNWAMFVKTDKRETSNLMFLTHQHARLFIIILGDFLSEIKSFKGSSIPLGLTPAPPNTGPANLTFLYHLRQVCVSPKLGTEIGGLRAAVEVFASWLEGVFTAEKVNLGSIDVVVDITVPRYRYVKMCGDIAKHNLARLDTNVNHLRKLLDQAGQSIDEHDGYLAINDFFDWFFSDIFICHASQIAEFLNNIRWEIYNYLSHEFRRSWHLKEGATELFPMYGYKVPSEINDPIARAMYWNVMNRSRSEPYVHRFKIHDYAKTRY